jgi:hypothetical protein
VLAWLAGFVVYTVAAQPPALVDHFSWIADIPVNIDDAIGLDVTTLGGTLPSFAVSLALYLVLRPLLTPRVEPAPETAAAQP